jgi:intracellular multiplication protein IcmL
MEVPRDLGRVPGDELDLADLDYVDGLGMANAGNSVSIVDSNESLKSSASDAELEDDSIKDINERYSVRVHEYARNNDHPDKAGSHVVKNDEWDYAKRLAKSLMLPVDEIWDPVEKRVLNSYRNSPAGKYLARHNMVLVEEKAKQKANSPTKKDLYKLMKDRGVADETKSGRGVSEDLDIQGILDSMELEKDEDEESGDGRREEQEGKGGGGYAPTARGGIEVPLSLGAVKKEGNAVDASLLAPKFVVRSRAWYQRGLRLFVKLTSFLVLVVVLETILLFHFALKEKESRYFAVSSDLRLIEMRALTEPQVSSQALLNWTSETVTKTLSLDFLYWKKKLMEVRGSYDPDGFRTLVNSLEDGGHLEKIRLERLSLSAVPSDAPVIVSQGIKNGRMTWKVELPLIISYQSSAGIAATQRLLAEVWVERVTSSANPLGIVIRQLVLGKTT